MVEALYVVLTSSSTEIQHEKYTIAIPSPVTPFHQLQLFTQGV
jgi:hypothetical protein